MTKEAESETSLEGTELEVAQRARSAGIGITWQTGFDLSWGSKVEQHESKFFLLDFPNGRQRRPFIIQSRLLPLLARENFEHWTFLGDYCAFLDKSRNSIEAVVRGLDRGQRILSSWIFSEIPGYEELEGGDIAERYADFENIWERSNWRIPIPIGTAKHQKIELGTASPVSTLTIKDAYLWPLQRQVALKIHNTSALRHDEALEVLERCSSALFFEFDMLRAFPLSLMRRDDDVLEIPRNRDEHNKPLGPMRTSYARQAVSLYLYGSSATGVPLLQYLAYYQAIEHFFPTFLNQSTLHRIRNTFRDPLFDIDSDRDVQKIIDLMRANTRESSSERNQLKITLRACIDESEVTAFLAESPNIHEFLSKSNEISGVNKLNQRSDESLLDQIARRVYSIRCRIVHTKEAGGDANARPLLPFDKEADLLEHDINLVRFLAQKVIIAANEGRLSI
ncbi:hypothetical protein [Goodfellowiella coeruleoviolacea]|uniref:Uncharacterized protein n=1 Tax=Goodfellowiella coeruleoviolacea TaxID=334858 RepID=A0AAE3GA06_9PSEU|nr:hypothetical protein [Goodfellowiella coeruleoviolacea]MCP2164426.1 hypothetical protein [Goodfellowiella coeruleoviolacea]